ncbi:hypothetical protein [Brevundimonas lenta]|uniref:Uncharacterized protein n=1 Tax=Brevundimonas lenta TaxID=424796 RepID=A0A7W6JDA7_9CAUL|nr:hypothetical protein [Brevundimonas lenta]MBB4083002.1 hypothetical protein [Brevundimonas lenta]
MIIWSGWGFLVVIFFFVGCLIGIPVGEMISKDSDIAMSAAIIIGGLVAGLGSFLLARKIESGQGRAYIDEATQQRIVVKPHAGSLFFIPTRYWAYVGPVVAIAFGALVMTTPSSDAVAADPAEEAAAAPAEPMSGDVVAPVPAPQAAPAN